MRALATAAALIVVTVTAHAAEPDPRPLRVALSGTYMPLHGTSGGDVIGFEADLANALADQLGRPIRFVDTRRELKMSTLEAVAAGKVDLSLNSITPTPERRATVDFTRPYLELSYRLAGKQDWLATADLAKTKARVAAPSAATRAAVVAAMPLATVVECMTVSSGVDLVVAGKADWVADESVGLQLAVREAPLLVAEAAFGASALAIAAPKGQAARYDAVLEKLAPDIAELTEKWQPGALFTGADEDALFERLPARLKGLRSLGGALVRPEYCNGEPPALGFVHGDDGTLQMYAALGQDSNSFRVEHVVALPSRAIRLKARGSGPSAGGAYVFDIEPARGAGRWHCKDCHPAVTEFVDEANEDAFEVHDFDEAARDENGDCGPP